MNNKIDWRNHSIAFFSSLFGILIAFELDGYREDKRAVEELKSALESVKEEIDHNLQIYKKNSENLGDWLEYWKLIDTKDSEGLLTIETIHFKQLQNSNPDRYADWQLINENDSLMVLLTSNDFIIDVLPLTGISQSSWRATIYSGEINKVNNQLLNDLNEIYEWVEKDLNTSDQKLLEDALFAKYDDISLIVDYYTRIQKVHSLKYSRIKEVYDRLEW